LPVVMMTATHSLDLAVECMKRGAYDFLTKPFDFDRLQTSLRNALHCRELRARVQVLEGALAKTHGFDQIIGHAPGLREVVEQSRRASASDSDILILGESGSGKEVLARAIHFNSSRREGPFVAINCGAIPESLLESELFGHEKGSFTGAISQRAGCFEQAHGGTLFLDEIAEMRADMQVRLLRAFERREIRRVGGDRIIKVNTRVISATNQDIAQKLRNNTFRADLYYRLAILVLEVPSLRDRPQNIGSLAQYFLDEARKEGHTHAVAFASDALEVLLKYKWPGNVRELRNAVERAVVFEDSTVIQRASLPPEILRSTLGPEAVPPPRLTETDTAETFRSLLAQTPGPRQDGQIRPPAPQAAAPPLPPAREGWLPSGRFAVPRPPAEGEVLTLVQEEKRIILRTLLLTGGNISDAARRLGVHRSTLHRKMARYGLATDETLAAQAAQKDEA
jgi:DNA-binding NtrC family response regulator